MIFVTLVIFIEHKEFCKLPREDYNPPLHFTQYYMGFYRHIRKLSHNSLLWFDFSVSFNTFHWRKCSYRNNLMNYYFFFKVLTNKSS